MTETYCTKTDVQLKQGSNSTVLSDAQYTLLINEAESTINAEIRIDPIADGTYASLKDSRKLIFQSAASAFVAVTAVLYNQGDFTSGQISNLINVNWTIYHNAIKALKQKYATDFIEEN